MGFLEDGEETGADFFVGVAEADDEAFLFRLEVVDFSSLLSVGLIVWNSKRKDFIIELT